MKYWRGQNPKIMGLHNSIMKLHNSMYGAPVNTIQFAIEFSFNVHGPG